jgi:hypothetical protein
MDNKTINKIKKLEWEQELLYDKYYDGTATKKDIKRIDELTSELLEIQYDE